MITRKDEDFFDNVNRIHKKACATYFYFKNTTEYFIDNKLKVKYVYFWRICSVSCIG